jgi:hypothetical protein
VKLICARPLNYKSLYRGPPVEVPYFSSCYCNETANFVLQYYRVTLASPKLPATASVSYVLFRIFHWKTHKQSIIATHAHTHTLFTPGFYHPLSPTASVEASPNQKPPITECLMDLAVDNTHSLHQQLNLQHNKLCDTAVLELVNKGRSSI